MPYLSVNRDQEAGKASAACICGQRQKGQGMEQEKGKSAPRWDEAGVEAGKFEAFREIVSSLRGEGGCPWDRGQTFESLKPCMINEMTEAIGAIAVYKESGDAGNLCEELGDVLLQVVLQAQIAQEEGLFTIEDVIREISRKMIRRHPHVFGADRPEKMTEEIPGLWEAVKREEKKNRTAQQKQREKDAFQNAAKEVTAHLSVFTGNP